MIKKMTKALFTNPIPVCYNSDINMYDDQDANGTEGSSIKDYNHHFGREDPSNTYFQTDSLFNDMVSKLVEDNNYLNDMLQNSFDNNGKTLADDTAPIVNDTSDSSINTLNDSGYSSKFFTNIWSPTQDDQGIADVPSFLTTSPTNEELGKGTLAASNSLSPVENGSADYRPISNEISDVMMSFENIPTTNFRKAEGRTPLYKLSSSSITLQPICDFTGGESSPTSNLARNIQPLVTNEANFTFQKSLPQQPAALTLTSEDTNGLISSYNAILKKQLASMNMDNITNNSGNINNIQQMVTAGGGSGGLYNNKAALDSKNYLNYNALHQLNSHNLQRSQPNQGAMMMISQDSQNFSSTNQDPQNFLNVNALHQSHTINNSQRPQTNGPLGKAILGSSASRKLKKDTISIMRCHDDPFQSVTAAVSNQYNGAFRRPNYNPGHHNLNGGMVHQTGQVIYGTQHQRYTLPPPPMNPHPYYPQHVGPAHPNVPSVYRFNAKKTYSCLTLQYYLEECFSQFKSLEKERKKCEAELARKYPGKNLCSTNGILVPHLSPNPSRVDRMIVDHWKEHSRVVTLFSKMQNLHNLSFPLGMLNKMEMWINTIRVVQQKRREEIENGQINRFNTMKAGGGMPLMGGPQMSSPKKFQDDRDIMALSLAIKELGRATKIARTTLWSALMLTTEHKGISKAIQDFQGVKREEGFKTIVDSKKSDDPIIGLNNKDDYIWGHFGDNINRDIPSLHRGHLPSNFGYNQVGLSMTSK